MQHSDENGTEVQQKIVIMQIENTKCNQTMLSE